MVTDKNRCKHQFFEIEKCAGDYPFIGVFSGIANYKENETHEERLQRVKPGYIVVGCPHCGEIRKLSVDGQLEINPKIDRLLPDL